MGTQSRPFHSFFADIRVKAQLGSAALCQTDSSLHGLGASVTQHRGDAAQVQDAAVPEHGLVQILRGHVACGAVLAVVEHAGLAGAGLLEHHTGAVGGVKGHTGAVHALGPDLVADVLAKFICAKAADPCGLHAQLCRANGSVALGPRNADAVVGNIA